MSEEYVLTDFDTGFRVARFQSEEGGKKAVDYLCAAYIVDSPLSLIQLNRRDLGAIKNVTVRQEFELQNSSRP